MTITYDREVDALYIRFKETTVTTEHLAEGIAVDYDAEGRLAGIEILDAARRLDDPGVFKRVTLEGLAISEQPPPER
jgi:YD repeat-containing protein